MARNPFNRVAVFIERKALRAERHVLIKLDVVPKNARFANHDARAVINEKPLADLRAGMNVNAGFGMRHFRHHARNERHAAFEKLMRDALVNHDAKAGIAENRFAIARGRRIAFKRGLRVEREQAADIRQRLNQLIGCLLRL